MSELAGMDLVPSYNSSNTITSPHRTSSLPVAKQKVARPWVEVGGNQLISEAITTMQIGLNECVEDTLPSPGLSPTLAAADSSLNAAPWEQERLPTRYADTPATSMEKMLQLFDQMPDDLRSAMLYQMLRRCPSKILRLVSNIISPALKCDFLAQLPTEISLIVLSYLDHKDLCRGAQVSKTWRNLIDTNETGWKELLDRDGLVVPPGELDKAIQQGWGWQDPVGYTGCEIDLSRRARDETDSAENCAAGIGLHKRFHGPVTRSSKRKRAPVPLSLATVERAKRRVSNNMARPSSAAPVWHPHGPKHSRKGGPIAHASEAALAVPDPGLGLPSLRKLHLYKSLYRRLHMIRQGWINQKVKPLHTAFVAHPRHVITCLQFDDDKIVSGSDDNFINVFETKTGKLLKKLTGHDGGVWALQFVGNTLVSGSTDRTVRVWNLDTGECTHIFHGHVSTVRCLQIIMPAETQMNGHQHTAPARPLIVTGSRDSQLRIWNLPEVGARNYLPVSPPSSDHHCPYYVRSLRGHTHSVRVVAAHGDTLVSGSYDCSVRVWKVSTGECRHVLQGHQQKVYTVVLDTTRNRCISGSMDSNIRIWDLETGKCLHTLEGHSLLVGLLDLQAEKLVSAAADGTLRVWDPQSGRCRNVLSSHAGAITCFQHDSHKVISGSEKTVKLWDVRTGECVQDLLSGLTGVWQVSFDHRRCVVAVQRNLFTFLEIFDFGAARDGVPESDLGVRKVLNHSAVPALVQQS